MRVSVNYNGRIKGLDKVLTAALEKYVVLDYEHTDEACKEFGRLLREIAELAWVCRMSAKQSGRYFGYEMEVYVTERGLQWQRYRTEADPPPPLADHLNAGHCWQVWPDRIGQRYFGDWNLVSIPMPIGTFGLSSSHLFQMTSLRLSSRPPERRCLDVNGKRIISFASSM